LRNGVAPVNSNRPLITGGCRLRRLTSSWPGQGPFRRRGPHDGVRVGASRTSGQLEANGERLLAEFGASSTFRGPHETDSGPHLSGTVRTPYEEFQLQIPAPRRRPGSLANVVLVLLGRLWRSFAFAALARTYDVTAKTLDLLPTHPTTPNPCTPLPLPSFPSALPDQSSRDWMVAGRPSAPCRQ